MRVAVTGGTGSFGSHFIRDAILRGDERIVCVSRDELKQGDMNADIGHHPTVRFMLGDVRDQARMRQVFTGCDVVVHAAALKRIESVYSQTELVKTNILGTMSVIDAALEAGVKKVVLISSDKSVESTNAYGTTKAAAEQIAVHANSYTVPRGLSVLVVRYGNVVGSRGSVLGIWAIQHKQGQPLTITDPQMTRFLITLPQAVALVREVLEIGEPGGIYVPLLPACKVEDLARALYPGAEVAYTGMRPGGEKLWESLLSREELGRVMTVRPGLMMVIPSFHSWTAKEWEPVPAFGPYDSGTVFPLAGDTLRDWLAVNL